MVWGEMKQLDVHLALGDYEEMAFWAADLILMYLSVQSEYERKMADNAAE